MIFIILSTFLHAASCYNFLVMNDIHLNINATYEIPMPGQETSI